MNQRKSQIAIIVILSILLFGLAVFAWVKPADEYSPGERRKLSQRPGLTAEGLFAGGDKSFMKKFEDYATDQFPLRDEFRTVYSVTSLYALARKEINGIYLRGTHAVKVEYPLDQVSIDWALERFADLNTRFFKDRQVYLCVIPDKNYFLAKESGHPSLNYEDLFAELREQAAYATFVDVTGLLEAGDYYYTDTHWRQDKIADVAEYLARQMGVEAYDSYRTVTLDTPFYGVYYGQAALPLAPDSLTYLTNDEMEGLAVLCLDNGAPEENPLYDLEKAAGRDGYELFLSGSKALITLENPDAASDKELVIFRDSFGSSLAPLLTHGYRKVTLVDIRYISPVYLGNFVNFENADILLLYSTTLLNDSRRQLMK